jgi:transcriptional regulator with XRE-family HTH domain
MANSLLIVCRSIGILFHMTLEEIIGSNVRGFRKRLGLTQEGLAELAVLHPTFVGDIERSNANMSIETLKKLSKALKVDPQVLLIKGAFTDAEEYQQLPEASKAKKKK